MTTPGVWRLVGGISCGTFILGGALAVAAGLGWPDERLPPPLAVRPDSPATADRLPGAGPTFEEQVVELVNQERWVNGQHAPLKHVGLLDTSAEAHSSNMASRNFFAHCDLDTGTLPWDRMAAAGYTGFIWAAENVAGGQLTPSAVMATWMGSPGHTANILSDDSREIGVGYVHDASDIANVREDYLPAPPSQPDCVADDFGNGPYFHYWTQNFGARSGVYPVVINREAYETATRDVDLYLYGEDWASEMRIRNEGGTFTAWMPFASDVAWQLTPGSGVREVFVEIRSGATVRSASDTIVSTDVGDLIFADGFESGTITAWDAAQP